MWPHSPARALHGILLILASGMARGFAALVLVASTGCSNPAVVEVGRNVNADMVARNDPVARASVARWEVYEASLTSSATPRNPFTDVELRVTVSDPAGRTYSVDGFHDGDGQGGQAGRTWKFRVSPDAEGVWTWITTSNDPDLNSRSGSFTVSGTAVGVFGRGPIVASPIAPRYFKYREGPHVFLIGKFLERNLPETSLRYSHVLLSDLWADADRDALVARHKAMNLNKMNLYIANRGDYGKQSVTPWLGTADRNDKTRFDLDHWRTYDRWVERLLAEGIVAELWFFADDSNFGSLSQADRERLFKYTMARLSAYANTMFVHSLEWDEGFSPRTVEGDISFIRDRNPWGRLVSVHGRPGDFGFPTAPWVDFMATQIGFDRGHSSVHDFGLRHRDMAIKPHLLEELAQGYETDSERQESWAAFMSGAAGVGTGARLEHLGAFASSVPFHLMEPANGLLTAGKGYLLARMGEEYVAYLPQGGFLGVDLSGVGGTFDARWYNPRRGGYTDAGRVAGGGQASLYAPDGNDWVLHLTLPSSRTGAASAGSHQFILGFKALAEQLPNIAGEPVEDEHWGANGDSLQRTTTGLMVWRKADNWTAFTDGSMTWINGPEGVVSRPNDQRFWWESG